MSNLERYVEILNQILETINYTYCDGGLDSEHYKKVENLRNLILNDLKVHKETMYGKDTFIETDL